MMWLVIDRMDSLPFTDGKRLFGSGVWLFMKVEIKFTLQQAAKAQRGVEV
jgi:hypothetical protein